MNHVSISVFKINAKAIDALYLKDSTELHLSMALICKKSDYLHVSTFSWLCGAVGVSWLSPYFYG